MDTPEQTQPTPAPSKAESALSVKDQPKPTRAPLDHLPPFRVLLHNDDVNEMDYVVDAVTDLTPLNRSQAAVATLEAHSAGVSLLLVTHKERAELYRDQFESKFLTVTIEPAE